MSTKRLKETKMDEVDLVVVGAGPAGLSAAIEARSHGLSVALLDEQHSLGGQIYRAVDSSNGKRRQVLGPDYVAGAELTAAFAKSGATHVRGAAVWNVSRDMHVNYLLDGKSRQIKGRRILLASGALERPFPIQGWTLPGVMGAGAAQILYKNAGALPSEPAVLMGCGPLLYLLAQQYLRAGVKLKALVHTTQLRDYLRASPNVLGALKGWKDLKKGLDMLDQLRRHGVPVFSGASAFSIEGEGHAQAVSFTHRGERKSIETRLVLLHQGVVPNTQLSWSIRAEHRWDDSQLCWIPITDDYGQVEQTGIYIAGDSRGIVGAKASATQGRIAAIAVLASLRGISSDQRETLARPFRIELQKQLYIRPFLDALYRPQDSHRIPKDDKVIVCRCEEITAGQVKGYVAVGCMGPNQTKAFGRCGMGPCQGRLCGLTVTEVIASERKVNPSEVGYYRIRPPIKPVTLGELANDS